MGKVPAKYICLSAVARSPVSQTDAPAAGENIPNYWA